MSLKSQLLAMAIMASFAEAGNSKNRGMSYDEIVDKPEPKKIIPNGCKEYHFSKSGTIVSENTTYKVFSCIASSQKVAIKKFNAFAKTQNYGHL